MKFQEGDVIDIGTTRENPIRAWWGTSPDGMWIWHSDPGSLHGYRSPASQVTLHSRAGFKIGDKATYNSLHYPGVWTIKEHGDDGAWVEQGTLVAKLNYGCLKSYIEPPRPKWIASNGESSIALVALGNWFVHYSDLSAQRESARFIGPNAERRAREYAVWKNAQQETEAARGQRCL